MSLSSDIDNILQESGVLDNQEIGGEIAPIRVPDETPRIDNEFLNDQEIGERFEGGYNMYDNDFLMEKKYDYSDKDREDMSKAARGNDWARGSHWGEGKEWTATDKDRKDESRGMKKYEKKMHEAMNMAMAAGMLMQEAKYEQTAKDKRDERDSAMGNEWDLGEARKYQQTSRDKADERKAARGNDWAAKHESYDPYYDSDFFM